MISDTLRKASWPIVEAFSDHPSYVAWGEGLDGVSIRVYVRGPLPGVPRVSQGIAVVVMKIEDNRIDGLEE